MGFINSVKGKILIGFILAIIAMFTLNMPAFASKITTMGAILVWLHVLAGIVWIGLLYYFNFVQVPGMGQALADTDGPGPAAIGKYIAPRALLWFRMAAATTWILGLALLMNPAIGIVNAFTFAPGFEVIGLGSWLGTIMAFNVWFIIWPNQQKILGLKTATAEQVAKAKKSAALASSINVILSIPMLLTMLAYRL
ncbi:urate hydroxylase PuuD [Candidatus Thioglobus sp.]|uniref:urate hydroxylase PuuD n=1 Tax=Candidatus Thioglobus sp. TaxID=2026721 RepID=UPI003D120A90